MKKKTFIVQLLDSKNPSRKSFTQVEDANFYSNDTDASLVFIPHEDSFDFQTAKVVMYNRGDESLVERDAVVTSENGRKVASYELPEEIISHWGDWTAQPVFISGGEIYSGTIVPFSVERYLMHERPPRLTEVVSVTEFIEQSQALVDDMEQAEAQRASAESSRISAEIQRASAESVRVSAEAIRQTGYSSFEGRINKLETGRVKLTNFMTTSTSLSTSGATTRPDVDGQLVTLLEPYTGNRGVFKNLLETIPGHKYIVSADYFTSEPAEARIGFNTDGYFMPLELNTWTTVAVSSERTSTGAAVWYIRMANGKEGDSYKLRNMMVIDTTEVFGAGNEPTTEEAQELIKLTGYFEGEITLTDKIRLILLMNEIRRKANKKQEDWITPTLMNGATGNIQFRKNQFGKLEFKGTLLLHGTSKIAGIPRDYAPMENTFFVVVSTTLQNFKVAKLDYTGGLYFQPPAPSTSFEVDFNGIVINLD